ncbi:MAG: MBL fold metallo-hydrolase [Lentisphaerota bacterium]
MEVLTLTWLGQSGFLLKSPWISLACDLYLSDYCQKKSRIDHTRKMPITVMPEQLPSIDHYLITHEHIDHFDPETVGPILRINTQTRFYCPPVCAKIIREYFAEKYLSFQLLQSMTEYHLTADVRLLALPAAHERLEKDSAGEYIALSYLILFDTMKKAVFFGGDTIPFALQAQLIRDAVPSGYELIMVLPVNGRDNERAKLGFKGNLTLDEAIALYHECNAARLIPCHWGMFALNDLKAPLIPSYFTAKNCHCIIPEVNRQTEI